MDAGQMHRSVVLGLCSSRRRRQSVRAPRTTSLSAKFARVRIRDALLNLATAQDRADASADPEESARRRLSSLPERRAAPALRTGLQTGQTTQATSRVNATSRYDPARTPVRHPV